MIPVSEDELTQWITQNVEENLRLEFKGAAALENNSKNKIEISKDVSAFANGIGGVVIYGLSEDPTTHYAKAIEPIDKQKTSKEWLEQVINSNIQPRIVGLSIRAIPIASKGLDSVVYVVEIPESATSHQAADKKYYRRFNFVSVAMEDYEIRLAMNRGNKPFYHGTPRLEIEARQTLQGQSSTRISLWMELLNASEMIGRDCISHFYVPRQVFGLGPDPGYMVEIGGEEYYRLVTQPELAIYPGEIQIHKTKRSGYYDLNSSPDQWDVYVRTFDNFGLALSMHTVLDMPRCSLRAPQVLFTRERAELGKMATQGLT